MENSVQMLKDLFVQYGLKVIGAIVVLIIGLWIIKAITKGLRKTFDRRNMDVSLRPFLTGLISALLKVMLIISVISMLGIQMTSFIAILGAVGLAVGMALSGTLQNFAGGVMILLFKPFKVGDYITAQGYDGTVKEIQIFNTILNTVDNKIVIIPNGGLSTSSMINYSKEPQRRVDLSFGIGYADDIDKAREIILDVAAKHGKILTDPEPFAKVVSLGDSSVNFAVRLWVESADYWDVFFYMNENVKKAFDANGISIPFPQSDVHIYNK
ncbi:MAG: mechanosensitive ion channel [Bacteroidia bacterium]|nr:mechanosensitive ion channel [Bacteroidia bacterium]